jgi:hypothetical protein
MNSVICLITIVLIAQAVLCIILIAAIYPYKEYDTVCIKTSKKLCRYILFWAIGSLGVATIINIFYYTGYLLQ